MRAIGLMYHDVVDPGHEEASGFPGGPAGIYKLSRALFTGHLEAVASANVSVCNDISRLGPATPPPVVFTFDDGGVSFLDPIAGLLEAHGWRGHFFITSGRINTPGFLSASQLRELLARGHVIGSHSVRHPERMAELTVSQLAGEWKDSKAALEQILGQPVETASVPGGYFSGPVAAQAAQAGYRHLFHSEPVTTVKTEDSLRLYGRFPLQSSSPASLAGGLARDKHIPRFRMWFLRQGKKAAKAAGGRRLIDWYSRRLNSR